ncbi:hypothetical protein QJS10_CPB11g01523 [Acorus calamus]|uniref:Uncharacterized protein n=1 Tax=Acorus calamus TaxID=4465 RepID=A0AAV9DUP9_ACOCL|nr:hypothetical protein QJS10_CPB11g01523 [Acorus calamus]
MNKLIRKCQVILSQHTTIAINNQYLPSTSSHPNLSQTKSPKHSSHHQSLLHLIPHLLSPSPSLSKPPKHTPSPPNHTPLLLQTHTHTHKERPKMSLTTLPSTFSTTLTKPKLFNTTTSPSLLSLKHKTHNLLLHHPNPLLLPLPPPLHLHLLHRPSPLLHPPLLRRHPPSPRLRRHRRPHPLQRLQSLRQTRETVPPQARILPQTLRPRLRPRPRHQCHHGEDQTPLRQLRQVRPPLRLRWTPPPHRERGPEALGGVHHARVVVPLHCGLDWVGREELPHRDKGREEAHHEGDHHRRSARFPAHLPGVHLAGCSVQGAREWGVDC